MMGHGVEKGDLVGIWAINHTEWIVVQFATAKIGAIMVNINPAYRIQEIEYALKQSDVQRVIIQGRFKVSDYVGTFYEACHDAYEAKQFPDGCNGQDTEIQNERRLYQDSRTKSHREDWNCVNVW